MQHIEDDMNELFQKAADNYHLQQPAWDWNDIKPRISGSGYAGIVVPLVNKKSDNRRWAIIISLFVLLLSCIFISRTINDAPLVAVKPILHPDKKVMAVAENDIAPDVTNNRSLTREKVFSENEGQVFTKNNHKIQSESKRSINIIVPGLYKDETVNEDLKSSQLYSNTEDEEKISADADLNIPKLEKAELDKNKTAVNETKEVIKSKRNKNSSLYFGLVAGPDFSKVKSMRFQNAGLSAGVIAGFDINKKVAIETGILIGKKIYKSEGKYFNLDKVRSSMPPEMVINKLQSKTSVLEIPVKIKYSIFNKNRFDFFLTSGISAYIITREKNNYDVTYNGMQQQMIAQYEKNKSKLPAVANFTIGYQYALSRNINVRVEPYLKIPLQGVGMGNLPVTSAGIHLGIIGHLK